MTAMLEDCQGGTQANLMLEKAHGSKAKSKKFIIEITWGLLYLLLRSEGHVSKFPRVT